MSKKGPIILIEDDPHDVDVIVSAIADNGITNAIISFTNAEDAMAYLLVTTDKPFVMLCDIRMQGMNGLEFRNAVNANDYLRKKAIPFIFLTAAVSQQIVDEAYDLTVQGFIEKPSSYDELKRTIAKVLDYWSCNLHPNSF